MTLKDILITKSVAHIHAWKLSVICEIKGDDMKFDGYFNDFGGFLTAITECGKFFAVRMGRMTPKQAETTRVIAGNAH